MIGLAAATTLASCDPWEGFGKTDDGLGPVDPVMFPAANLGEGGNRTRPGTGIFQETHAFADGAEVGYFPYSYQATAVPDPLRLRDNGAPVGGVPAVGVYNFDPPATGNSPLPDSYNCSAPPGYTYSEERDEVRYDQQGAVFAALPRASYDMGLAASTSYLPIAAEWPVNSATQPCQKFKSRAQVEDVFGAFEPSKASGKFMAWLIIDPGAAVYDWDDDPETDLRGLALQRWGWFNRYLVAYLDGGYIPTVEEMIPEGGGTKTVLRMRAQKLYYPRSLVIDEEGAMAPGARGDGYDVLAARRADADYSPLCEVWTYEASPMGVGLPAAQLPKTAEAIEAMFPPPNLTVATGAGRYVFCLQVR
jgi:hypothetical protein